MSRVCIPTVHISSSKGQVCWCSLFWKHFAHKHTCEHTHTHYAQRHAPSDAHRHTHTVEAASPGSPPHPSIIIILGRAEHLPIAQGWLTWNSAAHLVNAQYDAFSRTISSLCKAWWNFATRNFCSGYRANSPRSHCLFSRLNQSGFWAGVFLYIFFPFFFYTWNSSSCFRPNHMGKVLEALPFQNPHLSKHNNPNWHRQTLAHIQRVCRSLRCFQTKSGPGAEVSL